MPDGEAATLSVRFSDSIPVQLSDDKVLLSRKATFACRR
jgi:hypothetical protein